MSEGFGMVSKQVNQAEVWEAPFPYVDSVVVSRRDSLTGKVYVKFDGDIRPVVVVSNDALNAVGEYVLACQMTTKIKRVLKRYEQLKPYVVKVVNKNEIASAGLDAPSAILPFKLAVVHKDQLKYKRGVLPQRVTSMLLRHVQSFF